MADLERTAIGSPFAPLDTKQRAVQSDRTYGVLSQLSALAQGTYKVYKQEHQKEMTKRAKNDLVNNTINPDLQEQEIAYATTVAKGQALTSFQDMKFRMSSGEFDDMNPEDFQEFVNTEHKKTTDGYQSSKYYENATSTYNDFWFNNESTLTAGHAGRYRLVLKGKQQNSLTDQLVNMAKAGTFLPEDSIAEITDPDYALLSQEDRMDTALIAGGIMASLGKSELLQAFNEEFNFAQDPARYKQYQAAMKVADKIERTQSIDQNMKLYTDFVKKRDDGTLSQADWETVKGKLKPNGKPVVSVEKFAEAIAKSYGNRVDAIHIKNGVTGMQNGLDLTATHNGKEFDEVATTVFNGIMKKQQDPLDTMAELGSIIVAQKRPIKEVTSMAQKWGTSVLYDANEINPLVHQGYTQFSAMRSTMKNDALFYKQLGPGADRFKYIDSTAKFTIGTEAEKAEAGIKSARIIEDNVAKGLIKKDRFIEDSEIKVRDKVLTKALEADDTWFGWDANELDEAVTEAREYINQKYFENVNMKLHEPEAAMELAIDQVMSTMELIDGSLVNLQGADTGVTDYRTFIDSFKESEVIAEALPEDWDNYKIKVSVADEAYIIVDKNNEIQHTIGFSEAISLLNSEKQGIYDNVDYEAIFTPEYARDPAQRRRQSLELDENDKFYKDVIKPKIFTSVSDAPKWSTMNPPDRMRERVQFYKDYKSDTEAAFKVVNDLRNKERFTIPGFKLQQSPIGGYPDTDTSSSLRAFDPPGVLPRGEAQVDWDFIEAREGKGKTTGYVPITKGKTIGKSGVTIGSGVDLGSKNRKYFKDAGLDSTIIDKLEPFFGMKGAEAKKEAKKLKLTKAEATKVTTAVKKIELDNVTKAFNKASKTKFSSLPKSWQTVITSVVFQYGTAQIKKQTFWKQITKGDFDAAYKNLRNWGEYPTRRNLEADLINKEK